jgi:hypothetical protein
MQYFNFNIKLFTAYIKKIPIPEYWNGERMQEARLRKLGNVPDSMCSMCQQKDEIGYQSTRQKENIKSVIFADSFDRSFAQSPNYHRFKYSEDNQGYTQTTPHSLHINLGDVCNFACRMCNPFSSSKLQQEFKALGWIKKESNFDHWTDDPTGWKNFVDFLDTGASNIKVICAVGIGSSGFTHPTNKINDINIIFFIKIESLFLS